MSSLYRLLKKYSQRRATPAEEEELIAWYRSAHRDSTEWPAEFPDEEERVKARMLQQIRARMTEIPAAPVLRVHSQLLRQQRFDIARRGLAAASILLIICSAAFFFLRRNAPADSAWITLDNPAGKIQRVLLPDSSEVWLNANSQLRYKKDFSEKREIALDGEAFFKVRSISNNPFQVHSRGLVTRVLGTSFNVNAYKNERETRVSVQSGKVSVTETENNKPLALLAADQEISYDSVASTMHVGKVPAGNTSWINGRWQFETAALEEIAGQLENWYGVRFVFANETLKTCQYTAAFDNTIHLNDLLTLLCEINNIHFTIDETHRIVTFSGQGCQ